MRYALLLTFGLFAGCSPMPKPAQTAAPTTATVIADAPAKPVRMEWTPAMQTIAEGNNQFACDLFAELRKEPGNLFFSPFSIHTALAMTADGARNETLDEMVKVLHLPKGADARLTAGDVSRYYAAGGDGYELAVSNHLWGQQGFPWKADFLERQKSRYGAGLTPLDFIDPTNREATRQTINAAIEKATRDKIKELLHKGELTGQTKLVLTNAIYFKGQWAEAFKKEQTKDAPFTLADGSKKQVPLMKRYDHFYYLEADHFQAVEIGYKGNALSMVVLLPKKHDGLPALEKEMTAKNLDGWIKAMAHSSPEVVLHLPKFKTESRLQLADSLTKLGMSLAFTPSLADFFGMVDLSPDQWRIWISQVIHQSFIEVNEEGTEAAAATAVVMRGEPIFRRIPQPPKVFRADHSFLYLIRDTKTGNILFLGRYAGP